MARFKVAYMCLLALMMSQNNVFYENSLKTYNVFILESVACVCQ